jgi:hypothetical protein
MEDLMSDIYDDLPRPHPPQVVWSGTVANNVSDFATKLQVIIPGLNRDTVWKNCRWQARNTIDFPQEGDDCLVVFDDNNELWVVVWWPY